MSDRRLLGPGLVRGLRRPARPAPPAHPTYPGYRDVVRYAFAAVPHYRDHWARAGCVLGEPPPLSAAEADAVLPALFPFERPMPDDVPPATTASGLGAALREAAAVTDAPPGTPEGVLAEVGTALRDWDRVAGLRYVSVLICLDHAAPAVAADQRRLRRELGPDALLYGSAEDLRALDAELAGSGPGQAAPARRCLRSSLLAWPAEGAGRDRGPDAVGESVPAVLVDRHLGPFAARPAGCSAWHLVPGPLTLTVGQDGCPEFTVLRRHGPVLIRLRPEGIEGWRAGSCPVHDRPALLAREG
ncbi:MAG: hypothetical protein JNL54_17485 [Kineosporiaceae bacterium]|nr:hypothetical protein [Kineosporiaceae bacterium]